MSFQPIPAPGYRIVSGKRSPPAGERRYYIQLRNGFADGRETYTAGQIKWVHEGHSGDVVAVMEG